MARIGFDLDGVIYPFTEQFTAHARERYGSRLEPDPTWRFYEGFGWTDENFLLEHEDFVWADGYLKGDVIGGNDTVRAMEALQRAGHGIVIVTARHTIPEQAADIEEQTQVWLEEHHIPYNELHFSPDKGAFDCETFIEDKYETYAKLYSQTDPFVQSWLFDQPWNRDQRGDLGWGPDDEDYTVKSVAEYIRKVTGVEAEPLKVAGYGKIYTAPAGTEAPKAGDLTDWVELGDAVETLIFTADPDALKAKTPKPAVQPSLFEDGEEVRITDEKSGGQKGSKLAQLASIDPAALYELARVSGMGASKYDTYNYLKGYNWDLSYNAALRHLLKSLGGEDRDGESQLLHVAHAAWHCLALVSFQLRGLGTDTRYKQEEA